MKNNRNLIFSLVIIFGILVGFSTTKIIATEVSPQATLEKREDFSSKNVDLEDDVLIEYAGVEGYVQTQPPSPYIYDCHHHGHAFPLYNKYSVSYLYMEYPGEGKTGFGKAFTRVYEVKVKQDATIIYEDEYGTIAIITAPETIS